MITTGQVSVGDTTPTHIITATGRTKVTAYKVGATIGFGDNTVSQTTGYGRNIAAEQIVVELNHGDELYAIADNGQSGTVVFIATN